MLAPRADDLTKNPADGGVSGIPRKGDGGADGDRTHDLRDANATLSQLSYRPTRLRIIRSRRARGQNLPFPERAGARAPVRVRRGASLKAARAIPRRGPAPRRAAVRASRSEEHTSELQSLMRISYAVFCLKKK